MPQKTILFIGSGTMGSAILKSLKQKQDFNFYVIDPALEKKQEANISYLTSPDDIPPVLKFTYCFLTVKPQIVEIIASIYKNYISDETILISILAGKSLTNLAELFGNEKKIIRLMPNLAAQFSNSTTTACKTNNISASETTAANALCSEFGNVTWLEDEDLMHGSTAINGSSPAFFTYIIKSFSEAAQKHGLSKEQAGDLILNSMENTIELVRSGKTYDELIQQVSSKGGTTEAMLNSAHSDMLDQSIERAIDAAVARSKTLAQ